MILILYNLIRVFLYIIIIFLSIFNKKIYLFFIKRVFKYRFELKKETMKNEKVLIHLSSVGELNLAEELINELEKKGNEIVISVMTDIGYELSQKKFYNNNNVEVLFFPLDDYLILKKIYKKFKIKKTIIIETEIWPNLYNIAVKNGELYIVNGRLTEKKMKFYLMIKKIMKNILKKVKKIMVQSEDDKRRYEKILDSTNNIKVYKNLKYSIKYERLEKGKQKKYYENIIDKDRKIIVCGSTRTGEEKIWLSVYGKLKKEEYQLIIVPRHLDRIVEIEKEIKKLKFSYSKFSEYIKNDIVIVDKIGFLREFYQLADFVFVGGTLVDKGGHSILEPLFYGKVPIIGKYHQNIKDIVDEAQKEKFVKIVYNEEEILDYIKKKIEIDTKKFFIKNNEIKKILNEID